MVYFKVLLQYYSVLPSTTLHYKALLQYYFKLQKVLLEYYSPVRMARTIQVMPLLEDYREFFDFSPDWPGEKNGALRERKKGGKYGISQKITNSLAVNSVKPVRS